VAAQLDTTDPVEVGSALDSAGDAGLTSARRWFTSFGSCSVLEPLEDLIDLDRLPDLPLESA
jgi:hypothetical protein